MIDVNKLFQVDYLENLILQINNIVSEKENLFVLEYSFDVLCNMDLEYLNKLFANYNIKNENLVKLVQSDFLDGSWEYADLYSDDISISSSQKKELEELALVEITNLNNQIKLHNENIQKEIDVLNNELKDLNTFIKTIKYDDLITNDEIEQIKEFILNSSFINDEDRFSLSVMVIKYLIDNNRKILLKKELVDTDEFERKLEDVRNSSLDANTNKIDELPYGKLIDEYYEKYNDLFVEYGYSDILEFLEVASDLYKDIGEDVKSISKADFCIEIAGLLYQLNYYNDDELVQDALTNLKALDNLYLINSKKDDFKTKMLEKIEKFKISLNLDELDTKSDKTKLINIIKMLQDELINNIINDEREKEIYREFENLKSSVGKIIQKNQILEKISNSDLKIKQMLNIPMIFELLGNELYDELVSLQEKILRLHNEVNENGISKEISSKLSNYNDLLVRLDKKLKLASKENDKQILKGFVLFDVAENGQPYVLTDLDPSSKDKLVDRAIEPDKLKKGYDDYNKLIRDLHLIGTVERLSYNDSYGYSSDRLNEPIYWDVSNRSHENETGMYRLKCDRMGVERFVERKIVLHFGTKLYQQVTDIIKEILPYVDFEPSEDVSLYINFASLMKLDDRDSYAQALKRYKRQSPLYKLFIDNRYNLKKIESLSLEECDLLKDFINLTIQSYIELEEKNPCFNFDIIRQMGGLKTRG